MDPDVWAIVIAEVHAAARRVKTCWYRQPRFPDRLIVAMDLWRTWHSQSLSWACDRSNYGPLFRPRNRQRTRDRRCLPSISQFRERYGDAISFMPLSKMDCVPVSALRSAALLGTG